MAANNQTILEAVYLEGTNDYQQRVPDPTQSSIAETMEFLFDPMNKRYLNMFIDVLINRVAFTYVRGKRWDNKLAPLKGSKINYGSTIQEIAPKWIAAHSYDDEAETLLKLHRPEAQAWYHSQNRRDKYEISINIDELRTAFTEEMGLNNLIAKIMEVPMSSDNYDEYRIMVQLMAEYHHRWGFFKHHLSAVPTDEETGKEFLTAMKTYAGLLEFPSTLYNSAAITDIPVFASPDELVLFVTPATNASVDVNTLASVFNLDKAENKVRKIVIDEFPIPNAVALLTTADFYVCHDTLYENTSFYNPETLTTNYYLHHWGIYSVSPFVPAILFTTDAGTAINTIKQTVTGMTLTASPTTVAPGGDVQLTATLTGTINPTGTAIKVAPDSAIYDIVGSVTTGSGTDATTDPVDLDYLTHVDEYGVLHVSSKEASGTVITVTAAATYINPSGKTTDYDATVEVTVN